MADVFRTTVADNVAPTTEFKVRVDQAGDILVTATTGDDFVIALFRDVSPLIEALQQARAKRKEVLNG